MARWSWSLGNRPNYHPYRDVRVKGLPRIPAHYTAPVSKDHGGASNNNNNNNNNNTQPPNAPSPYKPVSSVQSNPLETLRAYHKNSTQFQAQHEHVPHAPSANLIQLYYAYFHSSHPFMLPPAYLVKTNVAKLTHLMPVVRYIGSFFAANAPRDSFRDAAEYTLFRQNAPKNGFTVQAMLLFAIGLHASNEQEKSAQVKDHAVDIALEIGMNREEFSYFGGEPVPDEIMMAGDENGDIGMIDDQMLHEINEKRNSQDPVERVMQESWRRTWWELYFLDGILAGVHQRSDGFRLWLASCTVPLPCEEMEYNNGRIPDPKSLEEFEDRTFADEPVSFSSYAYRVEAIRILGQVLSCSQPLPPTSPPPPNSPPGSSALQSTSNNVQSIPDGRADAADASLVNWALHLPDDKKELVGKDRKVDEMLFQAHMIVYATSIYLHRPRSHLIVSLVSDETSCTPTTGYTTSNHPIIFHTSKAVHAANAISKLVTLPTPLIKHSPFFTCVLTLATIVHLSACSWLLAGDEGFLAKERIRLGIGALKTMEVVWGIAGCVLGQVKGAAREVFRFQKLDGGNGGGWGNDGLGVPTGGAGEMTQEEILRYIEEEGGLGGDVAGLGDVDPAMMVVGGVGEEGEWEIGAGGGVQ
ncbi:hypothetical protein DFH27DRAFT_623391 [Peziza echinospora]|nr:hypothetical protein DFH27DRAFT_623391 [Peziza echinospora]